MSATFEVLLEQHWSEFVETNITKAKTMVELLDCLDIVRLKDVVAKLKIRWDLLSDAILKWIIDYLEKSHSYAELIVDSEPFYVLMQSVEPLDLDAFQPIISHFTALMVGATAQLYLAIQTELPLASRQEYYIKLKKFASLLRKLPVSKHNGAELKQKFIKLQCFKANKNDRKRLNELMHSYRLL
jgi:hypothetical protein